MVIAAERVAEHERVPGDRARVIRDDELQQAIKPLVDLFFANEARQFVSSVEAVNRVQVDLKQSRDGAWWTVTVRAPQGIILPPSGIAGT